MHGLFYSFLGMLFWIVVVSCVILFPLAFYEGGHNK